MWTWESPDGKTRNQIDFILTSERNMSKDCGVITKVDIGSDHRMVRAKIVINTRLERIRWSRRKRPIKTNMEVLERNKEQFQLEISNRFKALEGNNPTIETLNKIVEEEAEKCGRNETNNSKEKTEEDIEIEKLDEKRKHLRKKEDKTTAEKIEYTEISKLVKKKRRTRQRRKKKENIEEIIKTGKGPKEALKEGKRRKISCMTKENGDNTTDREEIMTVCQTFYKKLYERKNPDQQDALTTSADTEEIPPFLEDEVRETLKEMKKNKAPGNDGITSDVLNLGGPEVITYMTKVYNDILRNKEIPNCWKEAKIIILYKKGDPKDIKNYRPISLLSHSYKIFTRLLQKRLERILDENQPREQAGFRKHFSTTDHLQALNQTIEKCNEYNLPLCLGFIDYEKAFDSVEHGAIIQTLRKINVNENYVNIIANIYKGATARIHIDNQVSEEFEIQRGVRQGDPISPKLFTMVIEQVFKEADLKHGINIDGEYLRDLRFADDVALCTETEEEMEEHLNILNIESNKVGLKIHKGKTKFMTNYNSDKTIKIDNESIEKVTKYPYLGQTAAMRIKTSEEINTRIRKAWYTFGKYRNIFQDTTLPNTLKRRVYDQCIIPTMAYGSQTWALNKQLCQRLQTTQRAMERKMLKIKLKDKIPATEIRRKTQVMDIMTYIHRQKWKWAGHTARRTDNRWTKRCTEWQPRTGKRDRGRPATRWMDDIKKIAGPEWQRKAQNRKEWKESAEGYILQWMDIASK